MNVLILYDHFETYTNTVFDHLCAFKKHSKNNHLYMHAGLPDVQFDFAVFDVILIHYSARVAFGHISGVLRSKISKHSGRKILFVQDEYDLTSNVWGAIDELGVSTVFTCVPTLHREDIYPSARFPNVRFVSTLTGYCPESIQEAFLPPSAVNRPISIGYRGRALPYFYGDLGQEKLEIAKGMQLACKQRGISCDIEWDEEKRIYGSDWPRFLMDCKATLGTESGANRFDFDGSLRKAVNGALAEHPELSYAEFKRRMGWADEQPIMNQISPRFFEAITYRTALILFEGRYSGILQPWVHYIPLRKDFSNVDDVIAAVSDDSLLDRLTAQAYLDVVQSGRYTYQKFIAEYDALIESCQPALKRSLLPIEVPIEITEHPVRKSRLPPAPGPLLAIWHSIPWALRRPFNDGVNRLWAKLHSK
ncbi:hypothetical protein [Acidovorax sp. FHTAMBA]|uniref:hypothetical protein n=1 Tax=Acidovorax sp. FHTAMBA TaxID=3140252 RepID=UPI0031838400